MQMRLLITMPTPRNSTLVLDLENKTRTGIIPNSRYSKLNSGLSLRNLEVTEGLTANTSFSYHLSTGDLLSRGANLASIIGGVYKTPVTFDNTNGLSPTSAVNANASYLLPDGAKRSHAPGAIGQSVRADQ